MTTAFSLGWIHQPTASNVNVVLPICLVYHSTKMKASITQRKWRTLHRMHHPWILLESLANQFLLDQAMSRPRRTKVWWCWGNILCHQIIARQMLLWKRGWIIITRGTLISRPDLVSIVAPVGVKARNNHIHANVDLVVVVEKKELTMHELFAQNDFDHVSLTPWHRNFYESVHFTMTTKRRKILISTQHHCSALPQFPSQFRHRYQEKKRISRVTAAHQNNHSTTVASFAIRVCPISFASATPIQLILLLGMEMNLHYHHPKKHHIWRLPIIIRLAQNHSFGVWATAYSMSRQRMILNPLLDRYLGSWVRLTLLVCCLCPGDSASWIVMSHKEGNSMSEYGGLRRLHSAILPKVSFALFPLHSHMKTMVHSQ